MTLLDHQARTRAGLDVQTAVLGGDQPPASTPVQESWRDFVFAEVWSRPGLDRRSRIWITLAGAACMRESAERLSAYMIGALKLGEVTLSELREAALHMAVYGGWTVGTAFDEAATRAAEALGLPPVASPPIRGAPWDPAKRQEEGSAGFAEVMTFPAPPPAAPYLECGVLNFVFGEMWMRPGLDQRSRRWLTLVGVAESCAEVPIQSHVHAAMNSGDATSAEMHEFVLQYSVHAGWPKGSVMLAAVSKQAPRVAAGQPYH